MNVDQLISFLLLHEDRRQEVQVLLPDGSTAPIKDLVTAKDLLGPPGDEDEEDSGCAPKPLNPSPVLIRLANL